MGNTQLDNRLTIGGMWFMSALMSVGGGLMYFNDAGWAATTVFALLAMSVNSIIAFTMLPDVAHLVSKRQIKVILYTPFAVMVTALLAGHGASTFSYLFGDGASSGVAVVLVALSCVAYLAMVKSSVVDGADYGTKGFEPAHSGNIW